MDSFVVKSRIETSENSVPPDRTEPLAPSEPAIPSRAVEDFASKANAVKRCYDCRQSSVFWSRDGPPSCSVTMMCYLYCCSPGDTVLSSCQSYRA